MTAKQAEKANVSEQLFELLSDNFGDLRGQIKLTRKFGPEPGKLILDSLAVMVKDAPDQQAAQCVLESRRLATEKAKELGEKVKGAKGEEREALKAELSRYVAHHAANAAANAERALGPIKASVAKNKIRSRVLSAVGALAAKG